MSTPTKIEQDTIDRLRKRFEVKRKVRFWGQNYRITPRFVDAAFGDGKKLVAIQPLNTRPNYYVVRVDSSWRISNSEDGPLLVDHVDEVYDAIEEQYGNARWGHYDEDKDDYDDDLEPWPALDEDFGSSWWEIGRVDEMEDEA